MSDWIGLGFIVLLAAGAVAGLSYLGRAREPMSDAEFERRAAEARGTMSAGVAGLMYALQKLMSPKAAEAVEVQKDLRAGYYDAHAVIDDDCFGEGRQEEPIELRAEEEPALKRKDQELTVEEGDEKDA